MGAWQHDGGFSLDASLHIEGHDREGLERLLRYCARPPFALERIERIDEERIVYHLPKPTPDEQTRLTLTPLEFISRLAALIPAPRLLHHRGGGRRAILEPIGEPAIPPRIASPREGAAGVVRKRRGGRHRHRGAPLG
ncbi:MAG: transposase [Candidatus Competibacterales bacterium]